MQVMRHMEVFVYPVHAPHLHHITQQHMKLIHLFVCKPKEGTMDAEDYAGLPQVVVCIYTLFIVLILYCRV